MLLYAIGMVSAMLLCLLRWSACPLPVSASCCPAGYRPRRHCAACCNSPEPACATPHPACSVPRHHLQALAPAIQICTTLDRRLRQVYNRPGQPPLVLDPHVLSSRPLEEQEGAGALQLWQNALCSLSQVAVLLNMNRTPCAHRRSSFSRACGCRGCAADACDGAAIHHLDSS